MHQSILRVTPGDVNADLTILQCAYKGPKCRNRTKEVYKDLGLYWECSFCSQSTYGRRTTRTDDISGSPSVQTDIPRVNPTRPAMQAKPTRMLTHQPAGTPMIFLDPSIIPTLPPLGGSVGHAELMGRPRVMVNLSPSGSNEAGTGGSLRVPARVRRSSSLRSSEHRSASGEAIEKNTPPSSVGMHTSTTPSSPKLCAKPGVPSVGRKGGGVQVGEFLMPQSLDRDNTATRPGMIRRTSSFEHSPARSSSDLPLPRPGFSRQMHGHTRTASDSATAVSGSSAHIVSAAREFSEDLTRRAQTISRSMSIPTFIAGNDGCIRLGTDRDLATISSLLLSLAALTPSSRLGGKALPSPPTGLLHPLAVLTPMAMILEVLVAERAVLRSGSSATGDIEQSALSLPTLPDGTGLEVEVGISGYSSIDWNAFRPYVTAVGSALSAVLLFLQQSSGSIEVETLLKGLRIYVGKQKKVFGEVASMYVDGYGFLRGWWVEDGMKGCAGEVGRWGDMVVA